jgi:hypothetical protein
LCAQDQKNTLLGLLFAYAALGQARRLTDAQAASDSITSLLKISQKRSFLAEAAISTLLDILDLMPRHEAQEVIASHEGLQTLLATPAEDASPEVLLLALHLWPCMPAEILSKCDVLPQCSPSVAPPVDLFNTAASIEKGACAPDTAAGTAEKTMAKRSAVNGVSGDGVDTAKDSSGKQRAEAAAQFFTPVHLGKLGECLKLSSCSVPRLHSVWSHMFRLLLPQFELKTPGKGKQKRDLPRCVAFSDQRAFHSSMACFIAFVFRKIVACCQSSYLLLAVDAICRHRAHACSIHT